MKTKVLILLSVMYASLLITSCGKTYDATPDYNLDNNQGEGIGVLNEDAAPEEDFQRALQLEILPRQFTKSTTIKFSVVKSAYFSLLIYDANEEVVALLGKGIMEEGNYSFDFDASKLPNGKYTAKLWSKHNEVVEQMSKISNAEARMYAID